jgi:hypothetical protein
VSIGSNAIELVVPRVQHTQNGVRPAATSAATIRSNSSARMANASSCGTMRSWLVPMPAMRRPFSMLLCDWDVAYATSCDVSPVWLMAPPVVRQRAARMEASVASLAEPWMTPPPVALVLRNASGRPSSSCIQSIINVSTSVQAGLVTQLMPCTPRPAAASSPRMAG